MSNSVNKVILVGRLGVDPEVKTFENGVKLCRFSLATSETFKGKDGEKSEHTEWHQIVLWRNLAGIGEMILSKGDLIYVEGRIRQRSWTDSESKQQKYSFEIVGDELHLLSRNNRDVE